MKNLFKVQAIRRIAGIIVLLTVIGFIMAGYSGGDDNNNNGDNNGTDPGNNNNTLSGSYVNQERATEFIFSGSNVKVKLFGDEILRGTFTVSGNTIMLTWTWSNPNWVGFGIPKVGDTETCTIIDSTTIRDNEGHLFRKV